MSLRGNRCSSVCVCVCKKTHRGGALGPPNSVGDPSAPAGKGLYLWSALKYLDPHFSSLKFNKNNHACRALCVKL